MATLKRNGGDNSRQESTAGTTKVQYMSKGLRSRGFWDKGKFFS